MLAGQAQKEVTVNEALSLLDVLVSGSVEGVRSDPPAAPVSGQAWIVGSSPVGQFAGRANAVAVWTEGGWRFASAVRGLRLYDSQKQAFQLFDSAWTIASPPAVPTGGSVIDTEARAAIAALILALKATGTFSSS